MKRAYDFLISMKFMIFLVAIFALSCAVATFIENDYGTSTAWAEVYGTKWFEAIQVFLAINLVGNIFKFKMLKKEKLTILIFHIGFLVVLLASALTRYYGFEGMMHIREGKTSNTITTLKSYIQLQARKADKTYYNELPLTISKISPNNFTLKVDIDKNTATLKYKNTIAKDKKSPILIQANLTYKNSSKDVTLSGFGSSSIGKPVKVSLEGVDFILAWGAKSVKIPYHVKLDNFELKRYPGSMSPSSYASFVQLIDKDVKIDYHIYMNHVLDYKNYRFFQSSYDRDEKGTVLSVNNDPGKLATYIGYFLISLGFILTLLNPKSRFRKLIKLVQKDTIVSSFALIMLVSFSTTSLKSASLDVAKTYDKTHAKSFGNLLLQKNDGRIMTIDSFSKDILLKLAKKKSIYKLSSNQVILGMMTAPKIWQDIPLILVKHDKIKKILGLSPNAKYATYNDFFDFTNKANPYKLALELEKTHQKSPVKRNTFDRKLIKVDERLNISYMIYTGSLLKIIPKLDDKNQKWYNIKEAIDTFDEEEASRIRTLFLYYFSQIDEAKKSGDWHNATQAVKLIRLYQNKVGTKIIPSQTKLEVEKTFKEIGLFNKLSLVYFIGGLILLISIFTKMIKHTSNLSKAFTIGKTIILLAFIIHTIGMGIRWYIGGHAPWSNAYESMLYIAWSMGLAGLVFSRYSLLAPALTALIASSTLLTTMLTEMDPQITNLVPVLKSYWLNIHVSILTASYGFLGLSMILGFFTLILFLFKSDKNLEINKSIIEATRINEMTVIMGLAMLTIGTFLGGVWANESWGRYWSWDPKETWSWISILVYVILSHIRFIPSLNKNYHYNFAAISLVSYSSIIMTFVGVNYYLSGMHSYAAGDPMPIPKYLYLIVAIVVVLILTAYKKRILKK